jgi:hypothetical protein
MRLTLVRGDRIALELGGEAYAITRAINDVLGLLGRDEFHDEFEYLEWLERTWDGLAREKILPDILETLAEIAKDVTSTPGSSIDYERLAPLLSQVRLFVGKGEIEVPSLAVLAAWALERTLQRGVERGADLLVCEHCRRLWFGRAPADARYCNRPAPGLTMTCAQLHASQRFALEREEWARHYRKIMARKRRGTITEEQFRSWKAFNKAGIRGQDWTDFDEWTAKQEAEFEGLVDDLKGGTDG